MEIMSAHLFQLEEEDKVLAAVAEVADTENAASPDAAEPDNNGNPGYVTAAQFNALSEAERLNFLMQLRKSLRS